jgi:hypothetical protein
LGRATVLSVVGRMSHYTVCRGVGRAVRFNELPTASMGKATPPRAATNIPIVTARPPDNKPAIAPRRREGEDRSEVRCCGASGSTSGLDGDEEVKLTPKVSSKIGANVGSSGRMSRMTSTG